MPPRTKSQKKVSRKPAGAPAVTPPAPPPPAWAVGLIALALALMTIAVYAQVASHEFINLDDQGYVVNNPHVNTGLTPANVRWAFTSGYAANWHPLTWISHQIDVSLFGMTPGRHHVTNVAWHVVNTLLLFGLLRALTGALWRSAFVAALFAVHPAHVESVAWVAERKDVLSACFWFATTWAYVIWVRRRAAWRYVIVVGLFALGLMSKPMLVTLPFTLLLLDVWPLDRASTPWARRLTEKLPLFAMAIASSAITAIVQQGAIAGLNLVPWSDRFANAVLSYGRYLKMLLWPADLAVLYPHVVNLPAGPVTLAGAVVAALTALAWRARRSQPFLLVGWLWFLGTLVPVIGLVQIGTQALADRYTYIPYVGLFIAMAWGLRALALRAGVAPMARRVVGAALVVGSATVAHAQVATWATSGTLWLRAVTVTTANARAHIELGVVYDNAGRPTDAIAEWQEALRLRLSLGEARDLFPKLGRALMAQKKVAEAIPILERATRDVSPERADLRHDLALAYFGVGRTDEALASWREAVRLEPQFEQAWFTMGVVLAANHRMDEARRAFSEVLRINPSRKEAQDMLKALGGK